MRILSRRVETGNLIIPCVEERSEKKLMQGDPSGEELCERFPKSESVHVSWLLWVRVEDPDGKRIMGN
jgi:hypothetical protein